MGGISNSQCKTTLARLFAAKIFMPCDDMSYLNVLFQNAPLFKYGLPALPRFPSNESCADVLTTCAADPRDLATIKVFLAGAGLPLNCAGTGGVIAGLPDYPYQKQIFATFGPHALFTRTTSLNPRARLPTTLCLCLSARRPRTVTARSILVRFAAVSSRASGTSPRVPARPRLRT